jgi:glycosyltransferase involved in cell wall biosynthesis
VAAGRLRNRLQTPVILNYLDYLTGFMETWPAWVAPPPLVRALTRFELSLPSRYRVDGVLTVSSPLADRLAASGYPPDRMLPILYGYDAGRFRPSSDPISDGPPVVVMHGSFDRHHLGPIAGQAVAEIARRRPEVAFRFVGRMTDGLRAFTARLQKQCPGLRLQLPGFVPYERVADQLKNADVGLIPYEESNGTHCAFVAKAVEYLGCGLPVASTPLMNLTRYFAEEPAMAFGGFDGRSLAGVVLAWLDRSRLERRELGARASERVAKELDWSVITRRAVDFMEAAVTRSGSHRP